MQGAGEVGVGEENGHRRSGGGVGPPPPGPSAVGAPGLEGPRVRTAETAQKMLRVIATDEVDVETSELLDKVRESITEVSANKKPRKRARLRDSADWTIQGPEPLAGLAGDGHEGTGAGADSIAEGPGLAAAAVEGGGGGETGDLLKLAAGLLGPESGEGASGADINSFALNAVVVLAKAALRRDGESPNTRALQETLENMHLQYNSLANETSFLQSKLKREKDTCSGLERDVDRISRDICELREENRGLKTELEGLEAQVRCRICYESRRNCLLMPCLHHLFCTRCIDLHFQSSGARTCPVCRKGVSGVLVTQLE